MEGARCLEWADLGFSPGFAFTWLPVVNTGLSLFSCIRYLSIYRFPEATVFFECPVFARHYTRKTCLLPEDDRLQTPPRLLLNYLCQAPLPPSPPFAQVSENNCSSTIRKLLGEQKGSAGKQYNNSLKI